MITLRGATRAAALLAAVAAASWCVGLRPWDANPPALVLLTSTLRLLLYFVVFFAAAWVPSLLVGRFTRGWPRWLAVVPLVMALVLFAVRHVTRSCPEPVDLAGALEPPSTPRVVLLAVDGLDPLVLEQLRAEGILPHLDRLTREGAYGRLETISPHSPVVWTSVITGHPPEEHGIVDYTSRGLRGTPVIVPPPDRDFLGQWLLDRLALVEEVPVSARERRRKALWEIVRDSGRTSLAVNWWASYPAERVGAVVSNRALPWEDFQPTSLEALLDPAPRTSPPALQRLVLETTRALLADRPPAPARRIPFTEDGARFFALRDDAAFAVFLRLQDPGHRLSTVYLQDVDTASHTYSRLVFGRNVNRVRDPQVPPTERADLWERHVRSPYRRMDRRVGELLARMEEGDLLLVVSDHGWRYDGTAHWGNPSGVFLAWGPAFAPDHPPIDAHVYDVMPTLAHLLGLPLSREWPGRVLREALAPEVRARSPESIASYGCRKSSDHASVDVDDAHLERLRALGYVD